MIWQLDPLLLEGAASNVLESQQAVRQSDPLRLNEQLAGLLLGLLIAEAESAAFRLDEPVLTVNRCRSAISRRLSKQPRFQLATWLPGRLARAPVHDDTVSEAEAYAPALAAQDRRRAQPLVRYAGLAHSHGPNITNPRSR